MRIRVTLAFEDALSLPISYQQALQAMVYRMIGDKELQHFLHNQGFSFENARFKPLCYSWLQGAYRVQGHRLTFTSPVTFSISSCWELPVHMIMASLEERKEFHLMGTPVRVEKVERVKEPVFTEDMTVRTLSPITIYSTLYTSEGKKVTHYYDPQDRKFSELIQQNLIKKAQAFCLGDFTGQPFRIQPVGSSASRRQRTVQYKGIIIKAWHGTFRLSGNPELKRLAYQSGVGGKNAHGFGLVEVYSPSGSRQ
ncbi:CRISPR-associated endoribonuclease Cas6 [Aneurinibacillus sp. UBA3580]|uniref:CRISPR-associated endoribonuclease Cas6 n=1 Tax=Aneurinibacillus sp. UBA3580 TaxID=1946041 RepID=UPI00257F5896|nr:CRISPR-associated endoribonuclease Cas6 [Aneurinibacillus sp. UBA3580]